MAPCAIEVVHGVALQAADFDRLLVVAMHHAGAFAQHVHRTDARAAQAQNIGVENGLRRAAQIAAGDLLDEARDVDVGGAGGGAGRVEAVEAAVGFARRPLRSEAGMRSGKLLRRFRGTGSAPGAPSRPPAARCTAARLRPGASRNCPRRVWPMFIGGEMRSTLPYSPPLPTRRPFSRAASISCAVCAVAGALVLRSSHQFHGLHQAHAAHVADERVLVLELFEAAAQVGAGLGGVDQQVLLFDVIDHRFGGGGGHGIAAEGGDGDALQPRRRPRGLAMVRPMGCRCPGPWRW